MHTRHYDSIGLAISNEAGYVAIAMRMGGDAYLLVFQ